MYGHFVVYFTSIICLQLTQSADILDSSDGIDCQPLEQVVAVNSNGRPYFVMLQRCQGSFEDENPERKRCTFNESENVRVQITSGGETDKVEYVILKNHTSCKGECAIECPVPKLFRQDKENCGCTCMHTTAPPGSECGSDQSWDSQECNCKCNLDKNNPPSGKKLDEKQCKFVCKPRDCPGRLKFDSTTCRCAPVVGYVVNEAEPDNTQQGKILAAVVMGEFVFLCLIFDVILYTKKTGLMRYVWFNVLCKSRGNPGDESAGTSPESMHLKNVDEENVPPQDTMVNRNGHTLLAQPVASK
ncbi:Hypothetical predicted protein [Paramuricea clavata]|nr:Hypothetical predicted protein [Paramuricea clavata]